MEEANKAVEQGIELSIQSRARDEGAMYPGGLLLWMAHSGELIAPWWSRQRDTDLDQFIKHSDHVSGSMALLQDKVSSVPVRVLPRDATVRSHWMQAEDYNIRLTEEADFGVGWIDTCCAWLSDYWGTDNGGFFEIIGEDGKSRSIKAYEMSQKERFQADIHVGPIVGAAEGIANLDSLRCTRTGNPEYPIVYQDTDGRLYKLHWSRVAFASSMPSNRAEMYKVGFCAVSRWLNYAQNLIDIGVYKQEKLGSRPRRAIVMGKRVKGELIVNAMRLADEASDSAGFRRYAPTAVLADLPSDADISLLDLISVPDGFDEETSVRLGMFTGALAFGVPIRWIWPASAAGATKADAMFQHVAGLGGGIGKVLSTLTFLLGGDPRASRHSRGKFLPPHLKLVFDYQDDQQDQARADIQQTRSKTWQVNLEIGAVDTRTVREQMLEAGDLTKAQFERLELQDGRLPDGRPVASLFTSPDDVMMEMLDLGAEEPLALDVNDPFEMLVEIDSAAVDALSATETATTSRTRQQAEQALAALEWLKAQYVPLVQEEAMEGVEEEIEAEGGTVTEGEAEKSFDFGVGVGNVIRGKLARGEGGRFINVEQLKARLKREIAARLAARRPTGKAKKPPKEKKPKAAKKPKKKKKTAKEKRADNRQQVVEKMGLDPDVMNAILGLKAGENVDTAQLVEMGLAEVREDGSVTLTSEGRKLLSAANRGDVDAATDALTDASERLTAERERAEADVRRETEQALAEQQREDEQRRREAEAEAKRRVAATSGTVSAPSGGQEQAEAEAAAEARELTDNRIKVERETGVRLDSLRDFQDGQELPPEVASAYAAEGLVEFGPEGEPRLTVGGRAMLRASDAGDIRSAKDALSKARERVQKTAQRIEAKHQVHEQQTELAGELSDAADAIDTELAQAENELSQIDDEEEAEKLRAKIEKLQARADKLRERAERARSRANDALDEAARLEAQIGRTVAQEEKKSLWQSWKQSRGQARYKRDVNAAVKALFNGDIDLTDFIDVMEQNMSIAYSTAFAQGAAECGIKPEDFTDAEKEAIEDKVDAHSIYLAEFGRWIQEQATLDAKLQSLNPRVSLWYERYNELVQLGKAMACADMKLEWVLDPTLENCDSCAKLNGKVKRASFWYERGIIPQVAGAHYLACNGYNCGCTLLPTDKPMSKGRLPSLP